MKKLIKIKLSDARVMDAQEMKMILGGTSSDAECSLTSGSGDTFGGGTGSNNNEEAQCGGVCGAVWDPATNGPKSQKCTLAIIKGLNGERIPTCGCQ